ncbi:MAG TPA: TRAP transporter small permease, partial [Bacteroidetes bacterium]|nr:TRAP transporter small permease [Bacteroidota bacterium]
MRRFLLSLDRGLNRIAGAIVVITLLVMVLISFLQVVLRNLAGSGLPWADVLLRHLVLWVGFFGAVIATRQGRQIKIDVVGRFAPPATRRLLAWATGLFTIVVCILLTRASLQFVAGERQFGSLLYARFPAWYAELAIPLGFALIALQVLLNLFLGREGGGEPGAPLPGEPDPGSEPPSGPEP